MSELECMRRRWALCSRRGCVGRRPADADADGSRCLLLYRLQDGVCDKACYPPGEKRDGGDWASRDAVCASGLTYMNTAEAQARAWGVVWPRCCTPGAGWPHRCCAGCGTAGWRLRNLLVTEQQRWLQPGPACHCWGTLGMCRFLPNKGSMWRLFPALAG